MRRQRGAVLDSKKRIAQKGINTHQKIQFLNTQPHTELSEDAVNAPMNEIECEIN
jgi:hypothetical protein